MDRAWIYKNRISLILVIFYTVGGVGIMLPGTHDYFLSLTFFSLLLSFGLLLYAFEWDRKIILGSAVVFLVGLSVEWIGVHTAYLFGAYAYGDNLGPKWFEVPIIIGVNWVLLAYSSQDLLQQFTSNRLARVVGSAALMTLLDVLMEPAAIKSDYWSWVGDNIPIYNYVCWFFISLLIQLFLVYFVKPKATASASVLFVLITMFFVFLNIF